MNKLLIFLCFGASLWGAVRVAPRNKACTPVNQSSSTSTFYPLPIPEVWNNQIPLPGQRFCDPVFGTSALRLTDDSIAQQPADLQQVGFNNYVNADGSINCKAYFLAIASTGAIKIYDFNPCAFTSSGVGQDFAPLGPGGQTIKGIIGQPWWSNNTADANYQSTVIFVGGNEAHTGGSFKFWKVNLLDGTNTATLLADFSSYICTTSCALGIPTPPGGLGVYNFVYCTASGNTTIFGCAIQDGGFFDNGLGYVMFKMGNTTTPAGACPNAGTCILLKFINGIDSASYNTTLHIPTKTSTFDGYQYTYVYWSDANASITYKCEIDKSGTWWSCPPGVNVSSTTNPLGIKGYWNTTINVSTADAAVVANPLATNWSSVSYKFAQSMGHGSAGSGFRFGADVGNVPPGNTTGVLKFTFSSLTTDPGYGTNLGPMVSPNFGFNQQWNENYNGGSEFIVNTVTQRNRFASDPNGYTLYGNEVLFCDPSNSTCIRVGHTRSPDFGYTDEGHAMKSPDGKYAAVGTPWGTNNNGANTTTLRSVVIFRRP